MEPQQVTDSTRVEATSPATRNGKTPIEVPISNPAIAALLEALRALDPADRAALARALLEDGGDR
jgi:hypothetical protein